MKHYGKIRGCTLQPPCQYTCPKCGSADVNRRYRDKAKEISATFDVMPSVDGVFIGSSVYGRIITLKECLIHHCRTCSYDWASDVLNPKPEAKNEVQADVQDS